MHIRVFYEHNIYNIRLYVPYYNKYLQLYLYYTRRFVPTSSSTLYYVFIMCLCVFVCLCVCSLHLRNIIGCIIYVYSLFTVKLFTETP
jgi:hypothetical protein